MSSTVQGYVLYEVSSTAQVYPSTSLTLPYHEQAAALFAKHRSDRCLYSHSAIAAACWPRTKAPRHKQRTNVKENSRIAKDHISAVYLAGGGRERERERCKA